MAWGNLQQDKYRTEYLERVVQRLGAENAKLKEELSEGTWDRDHPHVLRCRGKTKAEFYERLLALLPDDFPLKAENYRLHSKIDKVRSWCKSFPLASFPEPDSAKAAKVLKDNGMTLDAISASNMRHVLTRIQSILDDDTHFNKANI